MGSSIIVQASQSINSAEVIQVIREVGHACASKSHSKYCIDDELTAGSMC